MRRLLLIRHAESAMNAQRRWQGQADPPLSARGREQSGHLADKLAQELRDAGIPRLVTSDLKRAAQTADVVGRALGVAPEPLAALRETDVGTWSGLLHAEIEARYPQELARFRAGDVDVRPGGGESRAMVHARAKAALDTLASGSGDAVLVVTHLGVMRSLWPGRQLENAGFFWWTGPLPRSAASGPDRDAR